MRLQIDEHEEDYKMLSPDSKFTKGMTQPMQLLTSNKTSEWYTPPEIIKDVKSVLYGIELDPASNAFANQFVQADRIFTPEDDALSLDWVAESVFLNPPYCKIGNKSSQEVWMDYLISQLPTIGRCIALTKTVPGYVWWDNLFRGKWPGRFCITTGRIRFVSETGEVKGKAKAATTFWHYGNNDVDKEQFSYTFGKLGRILHRDSHYIQEERRKSNEW